MLYCSVVVATDTEGSGLTRPQLEGLLRLRWPESAPHRKRYKTQPSNFCCEVTRYTKAITQTISPGVSTIINIFVPGLFLCRRRPGSYYKLILCCCQYHMAQTITLTPNVIIQKSSPCIPGYNYKAVQALLNLWGGAPIVLPHHGTYVAQASVTGRREAAYLPAHR